MAGRAFSTSKARSTYKKVKTKFTHSVPGIVTAENKQTQIENKFFKNDKTDDDINQRIFHTLTVILNSGLKPLNHKYHFCAGHISSSIGR